MDREREKEPPKENEEQHAGKHTNSEFEEMIRKSRELIKRVDSYLSRDSDNSRE